MHSGPRAVPDRAGEARRSQARPQRRHSRGVSSLRGPASRPDRVSRCVWHRWVEWGECPSCVGHLPRPGTGETAPQRQEDGHPEVGVLRRSGHDSWCIRSCFSILRAAPSEARRRLGQRRPGIPSAYRVFRLAIPEFPDLWLSCSSSIVRRCRASFPRLDMARRVFMPARFRESHETDWAHRPPRHEGDKRATPAVRWSNPHSGQMPTWRRKSLESRRSGLPHSCPPRYC
jgi:hypothetical protein